MAISTGTFSSYEIGADTDDYEWSVPTSPSSYSYTAYLEQRSKAAQLSSYKYSSKNWPRCPGPESAARLRRRAQTDLAYRTPSDFLFTPSPTPTVVQARSPLFISRKLSRKCDSSPQLYPYHSSSCPSPTFEPVYPCRQSLDMSSDSEDDASDQTVTVSVTRNGKNNLSNGKLRARYNNPSKKSLEIPKIVNTVPELASVGETETEYEEQIALPTSRSVPQSPPLIPPHRLEELTPYLFEICRFLSIVPAIVGTIHNLHKASHYQFSEHLPIDLLVASFWAILTGWQCLALTTGLLIRWQAYYRPLSTLVRLIALQAICWPATHLTLKLFDSHQRPLVCWAIIGTSTCFSRSVQMWVTSNLWDISRGKGTKLSARRWDWSEVGVRCALPAGVLYFLTTWALVLKSEWNGGC